MAASKEPTTPDDLTSTVNPRVLNDTLLTNAKPLQINPHFQSGTTDDDYTRAHINADTDSGDGAIHHTLGHMGGAATFDHEHGKFTEVAIPLRNVFDGTLFSIGTGGISVIQYQTLSAHLVWVSFVTAFGTSIPVPPAIFGWYYSWQNDFLQKNKITPKNTVAILSAVYLPAAPGYGLTGHLVYRKAGSGQAVNNWAYTWIQDSASAASPPWEDVYPPYGTDPAGSTPQPGDIIGASGIYQYA